MFRLLLPSLLVLGLSACSSPPGGMATPAGALPDAAPAEPTTSAPVVDELSPSAGWVEYRDDRYGYGLAPPCYWVVSPTPAEGMFAAMSTRSYTEDFFAAHSDRGEWADGVWPAGAVKLDVLVVEDLDPVPVLADSVREFYASFANEQEIKQIEEFTIGRHPAVVATVAGGLIGAETVRIVYVSSQPDQLMSLFFQPDSALELADAQAILHSLVLTREQAVEFPSAAPSGNPDGRGVTCP